MHPACAALAGIDGQRVAVGQHGGGIIAPLQCIPSDRRLGPGVVARGKTILGDTKNSQDVAVAGEVLPVRLGHPVEHPNPVTRRQRHQVHTALAAQQYPTR